LTIMYPRCPTHLHPQSLVSRRPVVGVTPTQPAHRTQAPRHRESALCMCGPRVSVIPVPHHVPHAHRRMRCVPHGLIPQNRTYTQSPACSAHTQTAVFARWSLKSPCELRQSWHPERPKRHTIAAHGASPTPRPHETAQAQATPSSGDAQLRRRPAQATPKRRHTSALSSKVSATRSAW